MKSKLLAYGATVALLAASSLVLATPAHAAPGTLTISDTTDWTPGQVVTATLVDSSADPLCNSSMNGQPMAVGLEIYDADDNPVGGAYALEPTSVSYAPGATYTDVALTVGWLNSDMDTASPTYNMDVHVLAVCQDSPETTATNVSPAPVNATYTPVAVSSTTVAQDGSLDVTVYDESLNWCSESEGAGHSMGVRLDPVAGGDSIYLPAGTDAGTGVAGFGSFDWENVSATATVTIPSSVPVGSYDLFAICIIPASGDYMQVGPGAIYKSIEVTAATLPNTGQSTETLTALGFSGIALITVGAVVFFARRRRGASI